MNISYLKILQTAETFAQNHAEIQRFGSDFLEQLGNWATQTEEYPILFAVPNSASLNALNFSSLANYTITFYALDVIQKDRANINTVLNTTSQILTDLHKYYHEVEVEGVDIVQTSSLIPVNNYLLDYVAGWQMIITFEVDTFSYCDIPLDVNPPIPSPL